jgi:hypothetical protein
MNDPHVAALHYTVGHADHVVYDNAQPLTYDTPGFTVQVENGRAVVTMKTHHATEEAARAEIEPFLRAWELSAALKSRPGEFELVYAKSTIVDRQPTPGTRVVVAEFRLPAEFTKAQATRSNYPDPPPSGIARDETVDLMFERFSRYCEGRTTLGDAANLCLTALEKTGDGRKGAAQRYSVAKPVLNKLGTLCASKGGLEARKAKGTATAFTSAERQWLEETMKCLIRRAAEIAADLNASLPQLTMADLPPL